MSSQNWKLDVIDKAERNAKFESSGQCAKYVREAIQKAKRKELKPAGINSAKDFGPFLQSEGYTLTNKNFDSAKPGSIAIFEGNVQHPHGHIQILGNNNVWISDFVQRRSIPWKSNENVPPYKIYE